MKKLSELIDMYHDTQAAALGFFLWIGAALAVVGLFFVLVLLFLGMTFWAFDMSQRNQLIIDGGKEGVG